MVELRFKSPTAVREPNALAADWERSNSSDSTLEIHVGVILPAWCVGGLPETIACRASWHEFVGMRPRVGLANSVIAVTFGARCPCLRWMGVTAAVCLDFGTRPAFGPTLGKIGV